MTDAMHCELCETTEDLVLETYDDGTPSGVLCRDCGKHQQRLRALACWRCGETRGLVVVYSADESDVNDNVPDGLLCRACLSRAFNLLMEEPDDRTCEECGGPLDAP